MNRKRPVNLDLGTMKFPPMAIASILHRLSGVVLFLLMPIVLYFLHLSLKSEQSFNDLRVMLGQPLYKLGILCFAAAIIYHLLAGARHMLMDIGYGERLCAGRRSAILVISLAVILTLLLGVWIW